MAGSATDIIDLQQLRTAEDGMTELWGHTEVSNLLSSGTGQLVRIAEHPEVDIAEIGTGAEAVGGASVALPLAVGATIETALLNNQHWDNFWIGVGGRLNDVFHSLTHFLSGGGISFETTQNLINFSHHVTMRAVRQLYTRVLSRSLGSIAVVARAVRKNIYNTSIVAGALLAYQKFAGGLIHNAQAAAQHYADVRVNQLRNEMHTYVGQAINADHVWATQHIYNPLHADVTNLGHRVTSVQQSIPKIATTIAATVAAAKVAPVAKSLAQAVERIRKLETEQQDCTEPMCETVGPKSEWGKLFKKYKPALIWAMLTEIALLDPRVVEQASEDLARALGPVLETWTAAYVGILPGGTHEQPSQVTDTLGGNPFG